MSPTRDINCGPLPAVSACSPGARLASGIEGETALGTCSSDPLLLEVGREGGGPLLGGGGYLLGPWPVGGWGVGAASCACSSGSLVGSEWEGSDSLLAGREGGSDFSWSKATTSACMPVWYRNVIMYCLIFVSMHAENLE